MKKSRHTEEQIVRILREADQSRVTETARKHSVTEQTIYWWRRLYNGTQVSDVKKVKGLRDVKYKAEEAIGSA